MNKPARASQGSRAEQETKNEANRLTAQVEAALSAVAMRSPDEAEELEALADRIEKAARGFADALRDLANSRKATAREH